MSVMTSPIKVHRTMLRSSGTMGKIKVTTLGFESGMTLNSVQKTIWDIGKKPMLRGIRDGKKKRKKKKIKINAYCIT